MISAAEIRQCSESLQASAAPGPASVLVITFGEDVYESTPSPKPVLLLNSRARLRPHADVVPAG